MPIEPSTLRPSAKVHPLYKYNQLLQFILQFTIGGGSRLKGEIWWEQGLNTVRVVCAFNHKKEQNTKWCPYYMHRTWLSTHDTMTIVAGSRSVCVTGILAIERYLQFTLEPHILRSFIAKAFQLHAKTSLIWYSYPILHRFQIQAIWNSFTDL